jgi:hypothetical protein
MKSAKSNPMRESWTPADKAAEAEIDNPSEFENEKTATEDSRGPVPSSHPKTHGDAIEEVRPHQIISYPPA